MKLSNKILIGVGGAVALSAVAALLFRKKAQAAQLPLTETAPIIPIETLSPAQQQQVYSSLANQAQQNETNRNMTESVASIKTIAASVDPEVLSAFKAGPAKKVSTGQRLLSPTARQAVSATSAHAENLFSKGLSWMEQAKQKAQS